MESLNWVTESPLQCNLNLALFSNPTRCSPDDEQKQSVPLMEELNRMSTENKKLTQTLSQMCENYSLLQSTVISLLSQAPKNENGDENPKKRKASCYENSEHCCITYEDSCMQARLLNYKPKVAKMLVRTEKSDTKLVVKDGYQWRKYGQKVTRNNLYPRAYFKCANAPNCPVKKKVQRSMKDPFILVATYEGEHNHAKPNSEDHVDQIICTSSHDHIPTNSPTFEANPSMHYPTFEANPSMMPYEFSKNLNFCNTTTNDDRKVLDMETLHRLLVEKMAASLTEDPSFTSSLATAISGKMFEGSHSENWL